MKKHIWILVLSIYALLPAVAFGQQVHYVDVDAGGSGDGSSWVDAFTSLQDALTSATSGDEIWVAVGEYAPDQGNGLTPGDRSLSFQLKSGVRLHGGFNGTEATRAARDLARNRVVLSGDLAQNDDGFARREDNSYHVVRASSADSGTLLDGVTIIGGHAKGADADSLGGGLLIDGGSPWIVNTRINSSAARCGGGVAIVSGASPSFVNVVVNGNQASTGGGFCLLESDADIVNATVSANTAQTAAGIYNFASSPSISSSVVSGNRNWDFASPCQVGQFPCLDNDVSPEAIAADSEVQGGVIAALESGTLEDALDFVRQHADVVETYSGPITVGWRVEGGGLSLLSDGTDIPFDIGGLGKDQSGNDRSIIGEDRNSDGYFDNRDGKRALILSPFGFPDADFARQTLLLTPGYQGNVTSLYPYELNQDTESVEWQDWGEYDFIYLSTIVQSFCEEVGGACYAAILTAVGNSTDEPFHPASEVSDVWIPSRGLITVRGVFSGFLFDYHYELNNAIIHCSICLVPDRYVSRFGENFGAHSSNNTVFGHWKTSSPNDVFYPDLVDFNKELLLDWVVGLPTRKKEFNGNLYTFMLYSASVGDELERRIMELPVLLYKPDDIENYTSTLVDLTDVTNMVVGKIDDDQTDALLVAGYVYGIDPDRSNEFTTSIEFNGEAPPNSGIILSPTDFSENINKLFTVLYPDEPLESGIHLLESIVKLPDGTESRYRALVSLQAFSCSSSNEFGGFRSGGFTGAAFWGGIDDGVLGVDATLEIESAARVLGSGPAEGLIFGPSSYDVTFFLTDKVEHRATMAQADPDSVTYTVAGAVLGSTNSGDVWYSAYRPDDTQCPDCRASVRVDEVNGETVIGEYELVGKDITGRTSDPKMSFASGTFKAVPGSRLKTSSPYFRCLDEYWTAYEQATGN